MKAAIKKIIKGIFGPIASLGNGRVLRAMTLLLTEEYLERATPKDGLRYLFSLDENLYTMQGRVASRYGGGVHPKHRLINYHDYFLSELTAGQTVLDVGCGNGTLANALVSRGNVSVYGVDIEPVNIDQAKRMYQQEGLQFHVADATQKLPDATFDVVVLSNVLEHIAERPEFLRKVYEAARPEYVLIRVPLFDRDWRVPLKKELGSEWRLDATHETEYTVASFTEEMEQAGFEIESMQIRWGEIWTKVLRTN